MVAMDVACVNHSDAGGCRCDFVRLLRSVLVLTEHNLLRVTTKYVVTTTADSDARLATLQLFVALHEKGSASSLALGHALQDFDLVLSHLQAGLMAVRATRDGTRVADTVENAKRTKCHVVGCDLHLWDDPDSVPRFTLDEVFHRLTTHVKVDQMPIRDDATYEFRMNQLDRDVRLTDLPIPALHTFVRMLGARDLAAVSAVCTMFQHLAYEVVPGLELLLYSHQRKGLRWLLYREGSSRRDLMSMPHPYAFPTVASVSPLANPQDEDPDPKAIDLIDGRLVSQASIPRAMDFRGGLFCDEPGLGKTITMLALVLRTKGQRTDPRTLETEDPSSSSTASRSLRSSSGSRGRELDPLTLTPSATSLIVVPNPLLDHWKFQIASHVTRGVLKVFVDDLECKQTLPSPDELATYDLVITSFGRLTDEWKYRRPTSALEQRRPDRYGYEDTPDRFIDGFVNRGTSPLLRVHWVRIIVDEGHKLGGTNQAYHMRMARLLHADKRWVMTGTPTPNTLQSADLRHMHGLLVFLRDRPYGEADGKAWLKAIAKPFEQHDRVGYVRLLHLLNRIMMRHTKDSVRTLIPSPVRHVVLIHPTPREYAMYNGVAAAVRANLVITNKDPHTPGKLHPDSLLNPIHRRWAKQVTGNLRLATCGGGQIKATLTRESFAETINMLNMHGVDQERIAQTIQFIRQAESIDVLSLCTLCGRHLQLLMLIPCGHMACADCVESRVERLGPSCGICNASYDWEIFQMLQPGFEFGNVEENWDYDDTPTPGTGDQAAVNGRNGGRGGGAVRRRDRHDGSTIPVRQQHGNRQRTVPIDLSRFVTVNASKAFYVASRITELKREYARADPSSHVGRHQQQQPKVVKAIIFSQFKEHIWRVKVALAQQGIKCADFITGVSPAMRMEGLLKFRTDPQSNVLVLTDVGSHGLDLSFVTHIFLMDEIWDKSLEKQVVARAHRMGARHAVVVEQLLMRASVEEIMHDMNKRDNHNDDENGEEEDDDDDEERRPSQQHTPGSRAMRGFFAGEHKLKHKRHKHRAPSHAKAGATDKSSMQQRQLQHLLQSLRLIEEHAVAAFGAVQFEVRDTQGAVVRAASLRLPNPGKPPATSDATTAGHASPPLPRTTSQASVPRPLPAAEVTPSATVPPARVVAKPKPKKPAKQVRIKTETPPRAAVGKRPVNKTHGPHEPALAAVIDLTLSDSSSGGETVRARDKRASASQTYSGPFYTASSEEEEVRNGSRRVDDSETEDDEWAPVKRERATKRSPVKVKAEPSPKGKGKRKRVVARWEDEEEGEEEDYRPTKQRRGGRVMFPNDSDE